MKNHSIAAFIVVFILVAAASPCQQNESRNQNQNQNNDNNQEKDISDSFSNPFVPGASGSVITLFGAGRPLFVGGSLRYDLMYMLTKNDPDSSFSNRGRNEVYIDLGFYGSIPTGADPSVFLFHYLFGFTTSFETGRTLNRNFLIPYAGIELGGIYIQDVGNGFLVVPVMGINVVSLPTLTISIDTGLMLNTVSFMEYLGLRNEIHINFVL